jgi:tetratricopeptide (TPR) repeat protein
MLRVLLCASVCVSTTSALPLAAQSVADDNALTPPNSSGEQPAADAPKPPPAAVEHYDNGRRHYLAGRYRDALVELKAALEYDRNAPDLLYNVARVYENLGELDEAIAYYQRYLALIPQSQLEERDRTEKTVRRLQGAKQEATGRQASRTQGQQQFQGQTQPATHVGRADLAFWLTGGAALALLAGGATCGVLAIRKYNQVGAFIVGKDGELARRESMSDDAKRFALLADGLFVASGVALTSAALLFLLRDAAHPEPHTAGLHFGISVDDRHAQLSLMAQF